MTQNNTLNVKLPNFQLNKLKLGIKRGAEVTKCNPITVVDSNDENNFLQKLLLTNTQVSGLCKVFPNNSSANTKLSKI